MIYSLYSEYIIFCESIVAQRRETITLLRDVRDALESLPGVAIHSVKPEPSSVDTQRADYELLADIKQRSARILVKVQAQIYPRDARAAAWRTKHSDYPGGTTSPIPMVHMIASPAISQSSRELLREEGIAYWDQSGSLCLELPWAFYLVDRPKKGKAERPIRHLYSGSTAQVLHAMLIEPGRNWHVHELAQIAAVSPSTVHEVFTLLEAQLWAEKLGSGPNTVRTLTRPEALLDAWAEEHSLDEYETHRYYCWAQSKSKLKSDMVALLHDSQTIYALTLASGAEHVAPYATNVDNLHILVSEATDMAELSEKGSLKSVDNGENITFLICREQAPLMFRQHFEDVDVASNIQLYLDLRAWPRRGKEQAEHLRSTKVGY